MISNFPTSFSSALEQQWSAFWQPGSEGSAALERLRSQPRLLRGADRLRAGRLVLCNANRMSVEQWRAILLLVRDWLFEDPELVLRDWDVVRPWAGQLRERPDVRADCAELINEIRRAAQRIDALFERSQRALLAENPENGREWLRLARFLIERDGDLSAEVRTCLRHARDNCESRADLEFIELLLDVMDAES